MAVILDDVAAGSGGGGADTAPSTTSTPATATPTVAENKVKPIMKRQTTIMNEKQKKRSGEWAKDGNWICSIVSLPN